jgi:hypothetical protein
VAGSAGVFSIAWDNKGTACSYLRFAVRAKLSGNGRAIELPLTESNNRAWMPDSTSVESYAVPVPADTPAGSYALSVGMFDTLASPERAIELGLRSDLRDADGYYELVRVHVAPSTGEADRMRKYQDPSHL